MTGGRTRDDIRVIQKIRSMFSAHGVQDDVDFPEAFDRKERVEFIRSLSVLSVPVPTGEAFGMFMIEAMACGVPVCQPEVGAFPEIIKMTGGGVLYKPNTPERLAESLASLLLDPDGAARLGSAGQQSVQQDFTVEKMAERMMRVYHGICG